MFVTARAARGRRAGSRGELASVAWRLALAVARVRPLRPALSLPALSLPSVSLPALRRPSRRAVALAVVLAAALGLAYAAARATPVFAVRDVAVSGALPLVRKDIDGALAPLVGASLAAVDGDEVKRRLERLPSVRSAVVDRAFPHTLRVMVGPERPIAVVRGGGRSWVVSERGRVIRPVAGRGATRLPRLSLSPSRPLRAGAFLWDEPTALGLRVLTALPARFPARVATVRTSERGLVLVLRGGMELRLGDATDLEVKLAAADAVLRAIAADERGRLAYLDVSLPQRPVGREKAQPESTG